MTLHALFLLSERREKTKPNPLSPCMFRRFRKNRWESEQQPLCSWWCWASMKLPTDLFSRMGPCWRWPWDLTSERAQTLRFLSQNQFWLWNYAPRKGSLTIAIRDRRPIVPILDYTCLHCYPMQLLPPHVNEAKVSPLNSWMHSALPQISSYSQTCLPCPKACCTLTFWP